MSFDEEGDHHMSKSDFALMCGEIKELTRKLAEAETRLSGQQKELDSHKRACSNWAAAWDELNTTTGELLLAKDKELDEARAQVAMVADKITQQQAIEIWHRTADITAFADEVSKQVEAELSAAEAEIENLKQQHSYEMSGCYARAREAEAEIECEEKRFNELLDDFHKLVKERDKLIEEREEREPIGFMREDLFKNLIDYGFCHAEISKIKSSGKVRAVYAHPPVASVPEWISVKDRLPELEKKVFVTKVGLEYPLVAHREPNKPNCGWSDEWRWFFTGCKVTNAITHWMPLPSAPKEKP